MQQQPDWCHDIYLQEDVQVVYVPVGGSVYGFRVHDGERINNWEDIHKQTITAVVHPPGSNHVITGSHDLTAKVCAVSYVATLCSHQVSKVCPQDINTEMQLYLAFTNKPSLLSCILWKPTMSSQNCMT